MKLLEARWFSGTSCVGIVKCQTDQNVIKYYIGAANGVAETWDAEQIMKWGSTFPVDAGDLLFGTLNA